MSESDIDKWKKLEGELLEVEEACRELHETLMESAASVHALMENLIAESIDA